jgi:hypothetical protein
MIKDINMRNIRRVLALNCDQLHDVSMPVSSIRCVIAASAVFLLLLCPASAQHAPSMSVEESQRHLLQLTVPDSMDTDVPVFVRGAISDLKRALALQTDAVFARLPGDTTAALAKQRLSATMPSSMVGKISDDQWRKLGEDNSKRPIAGLYGGELIISVRQPKASLLLVQESFDIACGNDNVLLVYSNASGAWRRILLWQSEPYNSISSAFGDTYETLLLRPEHNGHPLLLVLHGTPWCTSTMSGFGMDVLELGGSSSPTPFWHGEHGYRRLDSDPPLTLRSTTDGFEVRTSVSSGGDRVARKGVMRYALTAGAIHRVEPLAMNARDSVEEWLQMPRTEAGEFTDEPAGSLTWTMFEDFTYEGKPKGANVPYPNFGAIRACTDDRTHFQAEVASEIFDSAAKESRSGPAYFVQIRQVPNGYRVHGVTRTKDASCNGPDLMAGS